MKPLHWIHLSRLGCLPSAAVLFALSFYARASILSTNPPAEPLTMNRIAGLPASDQPAWKNYLERSDRQRRADQEFLKKELREHDLKQIIIPPEGRTRRWLPLDRTNSWYAEPEARRIADVVLSFQTPAGGWSKNLNMAGNPRVPGMHFAPDNSSRHLENADFDAPVDAGWNYVGTFDNDATVMQLRFLARVIAVTGAEQSARYRAAFLRGIDYIRSAQYPNGGWPQVWPLSGGYHDAITCNDNAISNILMLLRDVSNGTNEFSFVPEETRKIAATIYKRGIDCILACQIVVNGHRTVWAQQYDMLTLRPTSARNYEMPSQAAGESAGVMMFLMQLPDPDSNVVAAVHAAAAWFRKTGIRDVAFKSTGINGRQLVPLPGNGPLWARYYEIGSDRPLFGDRDKTIHDKVEEISQERRNGYQWYGDTGKRVLEVYGRWSQEHPSAGSNERAQSRLE
jgi:PelA/Pel-15E family pectate lyase